MKTVFKVLFFLFIFLVIGVIGYVRLQRSRHGEAEEVSGPVWKVRNGFADVYGARNGGRILLFDAGLDPDGAAINELLKALKAQRSDVTDVFVSHGHSDHYAGAAGFQRIRVHAGEADADLIEHKASGPIMAKPFEWGVGPQPVPVNDRLSDKTEVPVGGPVKVIAVPIPGHTAGSFAYFYGGVLFVGDSLRIVEGKLEWPTSLWQVNAEQNKKSIRALRSKLGSGEAVKVVCTGHDGCTPGGEGERMLNDLTSRAETE